MPDTGTTVIFGGTAIFFLLIYVALIAVTLWSYGTLLKAATGQSKALALLLLIPFVNFVMIIVWGFQAHNVLKEREAREGKMAA